MTTPPRTVSILAILASAVFGVVLLAGALEIPVPAISVHVDLDPTPAPTPTVTTFDAPPAPPPPPPQALELTFRAQPVGAPAFTPMTVGPELLNRDDVQEVLVREYPALLRDAGIGGAPVLWIHIDRSGVVDEVRVAEGSGHQALDEAAMQVAMVMRFSPAYNREQVTAAWVQIPIRFQVVN